MCGDRLLPRELRERGERIGFSPETLAGWRGMLARSAPRLTAGPTLTDHSAGQENPKRNDPRDSPIVYRQFALFPGLRRRQPIDPRGAPMHVSIRTYRVGTGSIDDLMHRVDRDFAEAIAREPGFIAYQAVRTGERTVASITIFRPAEQAEASNELAAQWIAEELQHFKIESMGRFGGEVM
jgi:hypothetical protein